jgi:2-polyprenyl-3-methyl-5-hydroxy-6-metoxy-1,4-benzoquinol methylase
MSEEDEKKRKMIAFWTERAQKFKSDPRANTNDIWLREVEIEAVSSIIHRNPVKHIMDFGCANGYTTIRIAKQHPACDFLGLDINDEMISVAQGLVRDEKCENVSFLHIDILDKAPEGQFDFIFAIRVFQNIEGLTMQKRVFDKLWHLLVPGGLFYFIESYANGYAVLNTDRQKLGLPSLPIHPHLTLLTDEFDNHIQSKMNLLERSWPSSSYYLITRLLYSYIAMKDGEPIDYNHPIHQVASLVPQIGQYGPQKSGLYQKPNEYQ